MAMDGIAKQFLKIREFSRISGLSVSTIRRRVRDGSIPAIQPGGAGKVILFARDALERQSSPPTSGENTPTPKKILPGRRPSWTSAKHEPQS
jgi:hypothetical protein